MRLLLAERGLRAPSEAKLADMLRQFERARPGARVAIEHDGATLRVARGKLAVTRGTGWANGDEDTPVLARTRWRGEPRLALASLGGELRFSKGEGGIDPACIPRGGLEVALRRGGERLRPRAGGPSRTLKNLFQEAGVPEWERGRLPMLYRGESLVWAPGLGVDAAFAAPEGARGWQPAWVPARGI